MEIKEPGKYRLISEWYGNPSGTIIEITQVDEAHHKVTGPGMEWEHWEIPAGPVETRVGPSDYIKRKPTRQEVEEFKWEGI